MHPCVVTYLLPTRLPRPTAATGVPGSPTFTFHLSACDSIATFARCKQAYSLVYLSAFFFSSRRRHTRLVSDWSSDVCSSDLSAFLPYLPCLASVSVGRLSAVACLVKPMWMISTNDRFFSSQICKITTLPQAIGPPSQLISHMSQKAARVSAQSDGATRVARHSTCP